MTTVEPLKDRLIALDVLRGFALFGVLLVNMLDFSGSALRANTIGIRGNLLDQTVDIAIVFFAVTKFYLLFSFLFGVGFAVQMRRMEAKGQPFVGFYLRRLLVLFLIGMAHAILLWDGDILRLYALAGVLLLLMRHIPTRMLFGLAAAILLAGLLYFATTDSLQEVSTSTAEEGIALYQQGSYGELVAYRTRQGTVLDIQIPMVLVMFLVGLVVGRSGWLDQPEQYQPILRRWWQGALAFGLFANGLMLYGYEAQVMAWVSLGVHLGAPALSFAYACGILLHIEKLRWLAPVGQMALTNYLSHSLICTTLFYGYGFGLYDRLSATATAGLVVVIFGSQILLSQWWMSHFQFGPMEWLWRSLTYGQLQPFYRGLASHSAISRPES